MNVIQTMTKEPTWVSVSNPAAGADWTVNLPTTYRPEFVWISFHLATDLNAGNRSVEIKWAAGGVDYWFPSITTVAAGETWDYIFFQNAWAVKNATGLKMIGRLPTNMVWGNGGTLSSDTTNIQVGDQFTLIKLALIPHFNA
jgi:hypothetical protein